MHRLLLIVAATAFAAAGPAFRFASPAATSATDDQFSPPVTVLHGAILIDGTGAPPRGPVTIVIKDGRIAAIAGPPRVAMGAAQKGGPFGLPRNVEIPPGARVIDLGGRWLIPGLIDVHAHMPGDVTLQPEVLRTYLAFGITTARSTSSVARSGVALRERIANGDLPGPRFLTAGSLIDGPMSAFSGAPMVSTPDEARAEVRRQAAAGVDLIKLYSEMTPDLVEAAVEEAHLHGLPVTGHLGKTRWHEGVARGVDHLTHSAYWGMFHSLVPDAVLAATPAYRFFYNPPQQGGFLPLSLTTHWLSTFDPDGPELARLIEGMTARGVTWDPNLVLSEAVIFGDDPANLARYEPLFAPLPWQSAWLGLRHPYSYWWSAATFQAAQRTWTVVLDITRRMHEGKVTLTAGSDNNNPWMTPGVALHRELQLLADAGIPPADILRIATRNGAYAARVLDETGTIETGKMADLVVLTADPLADIRNTRAIERVFLRGKEYVPGTLLGR